MNTTVYNPKVHGYLVICKACHAPLYDLGKSDPTCPHCQTLYSKSVKTKVKPSSAIDSELEDDDDAVLEIVAAD